MASLHSLSVKGCLEMKEGTEMPKLSGHLAANKQTHAADQQTHTANRLVSNVIYG